MAYVAPSTVTTGDLITAAEWNQDIVENQRYLPAVSGDWLYVAGPISSPRMQIGSQLVSISSSQTDGSYAISFGAAFSQVPLVFLTAMESNDNNSGHPPVTAYVGQDVGTAGFTLKVKRETANQYDILLIIMWLAIGPA